MIKVDLKNMFALKQNQMEASFNANNALTHSVSKGDATEAEWINWFKNFGSKYKAERAFIIDHNGNVSEQIDIVLYDSYYSPLIFENNGEKYIPAESVFAVFEVKQNLNAEHIKDAKEKVESVRRLERISGDVYVQDGSCKSGKKPYEIIGGLLTYSCDWVAESIIKNLEKYLKDNSSTNELNKINFICSLKAGSYEIDYKFEKGTFYNKEITINDILIKSNGNNGVLISAYFKLLRMLAKLGNCLAIDYAAYGIDE